MAKDKMGSLRGPRTVLGCLRGPKEGYGSSRGFKNDKVGSKSVLGGTRMATER